MLTEEQYNVLVCLHECDMEPNKFPVETLNQLSRKKYIVRYHPIASDGQISEIVLCSITRRGQEALDEHERYVREKRAEEIRDENKMKEQRSANRFDILTFGTISAIVAAALAGLFLYYWPSIISFIKAAFHDIPLP